MYRYNPMCHNGRPHSFLCLSTGRELFLTWSSLSRFNPAAFITDATRETAKPITKSRKALPVTAMVE
jgi:hypothetical protein